MGPACLVRWVSLSMRPRPLPEVAERTVVVAREAFQIRITGDRDT